MVSQTEIQRAQENLSDMLLYVSEDIYEVEQMLQNDELTLYQTKTFTRLLGAFRAEFVRTTFGYQLVREDSV